MKRRIASMTEDGLACPLRLRRLHKQVNKCRTLDNEVLLSYYTFTLRFRCTLFRAFVTFPVSYSYLLLY